MTAPSGPIVFNSSTGSDTQASGLGPSTAVFGTTGTSTSGSAVVSGIDTTGVSAGDLFWGDTSSGRQFSIIASVDSGSQVTLDDTLSANHSGNLTWAIGGKRATFDNTDSRKLFTADMKSGWIIETESNQSLSSVISTAAFAPIIRGSSGSRKTITQSGNAACFDLNANTGAIGTVFQRLKFENTNGTKTSANGVIFRAAGGCFFNDCGFGDATNTLLYGIRRGQGTGTAICERCLFQSCTAGIDLFSNGSFILSGCRFADCGDGILLGSSTVPGFTVVNCVFDSCTNDGIVGTITSAMQILVRNSTFFNCGGDGISLSSALLTGVVSGNIFSENGAYGMDFSGSPPSLSPDYNAFYANTSGEVNGIANGDNDITVSADPFVDAASGDFNINNDAGGGALLRAATVTLP